MLQSVSKIIVAGLVAATAVVSIAAPAAAQNYSGYNCYDLWYERNAIYAQQGYCFQTRRAQQVFGTGCFPPYGQLAPFQRRLVAQIQFEERRRGC